MDDNRTETEFWLVWIDSKIDRERSKELDGEKPNAQLVARLKWLRDLVSGERSRHNTAANLVHGFTLSFTPGRASFRIGEALRSGPMLVASGNIVDAAASDRFVAAWHALAEVIPVPPGFGLPPEEETEDWTDV